jgi:predicted nucleotidyltransferase
LVQSFLARVANINERDELTHRVTGVRVFGSYLTDKADLGDIELAVAIEPRRDTHVEESVKRAKRSGKTIRSYLERIAFGQIEVKKLLKDGSPYLAIHDFDEVDQLRTPYRVLFSIGSAK